MQDSFKKFFVIGIKLFIFLFLLWLIYFILIFFFPNLQNYVYKIFNLNKENVSENKNQTLGEKIYNSFSDLKFPEPIINSKKDVINNNNNNVIIDNNLHIENNQWLLDEGGRQIIILPNTENKD